MQYHSTDFKTQKNFKNKVKSLKQPKELSKDNRLKRQEVSK